LTGEEKVVECKSSAKHAGAAEAVVMHNLAVSAFRLGKMEAALKFISRACAHAEAPASWHRNHAEILDRCGNSTAAEAAARLALSRDPDHAGTWDTLGTILAQRDSHAESCACYKRAVEIEPNSVQALNNLAVTLARLGRRKAAVARYRQALSLAPESPQIQLNFATLLGELGHYQEGLEIVRAVLDLCPDSTRARSIATEFTRELKRQAKLEQKKNKDTRAAYALSMTA